MSARLSRAAPLCARGDDVRRSVGARLLPGRGGPSSFSRATITRADWLGASSARFDKNPTTGHLAETRGSAASFGLCLEDSSISSSNPMSTSSSASRVSSSSTSMRRLPRLHRAALDVIERAPVVANYDGRRRFEGADLLQIGAPP